MLAVEVYEICYPPFYPSWIYSLDADTRMGERG